MNLTLTERQQTILQKAADTCPVIYSINPDIEVKVNYNWPVVV